MWTPLIFASGIPLLRAAWVDRRTALISAYVWAVAAWLAWGGNAVSGSFETRYLSVCLTACAGIAVLGARRPGAIAWNAVVLGLLAVLLMPLIQRLLVSADLPIDPISLWFLGIAVFVGLVNYLPTLRGLGALAMLVACLLDVQRLDSDQGEWERNWIMGLAAAAPWLAAIPLWLRGRGGAGDRAWGDFRDRFGVVWAARLRDQFNRAAEHAGLSLQLGWRGLHRIDRATPSLADHAAGRELLAALMSRFQ
jgi:hypothetical protein